MPEHLSWCVDMLSRASPQAVIKRRSRWLRKWTQRAKEIGLDPDPAWDIPDPHMAAVMSCKRLQLLDEIIAAEGYGDINLASDLRAGFDLVGRAPESNVLPGKITPATMHPDDLVSTTVRAREALKLSLGSSGDAEQDLRLWNKTLEEVERGWLIGPYDWDELGDTDVVSHRFPLVQGQGGKLRPIDDYSRSGVNACVTTLEQPTVDTVDVAACMFSNLCSGLAKNKRCSKLMGRSFDLTAAYRQLCVSLASRNFAVLAVYNPHAKKTMLFTQVYLPFGARASVNGFIRCSRCIQWLATKCLLIPTTSYYDDFIVASPDDLADNTGDTMELLFKLLGWVFDSEGPKADVFSRHVSALGVSFDLTETEHGVISVDNTVKRKDDVSNLISAVLDRGELSYKQGLELRGKLAFANAQVMGRGLMVTLVWPLTSSILGFGQLCKAELEGRLFWAIHMHRQAALDAEVLDYVLSFLEEFERPIADCIGLYQDDSRSMISSPVDAASSARALSSLSSVTFLHRALTDRWWLDFDPPPLASNGTAEVHSPWRALKQVAAWMGLSGLYLPRPARD
ncbi:ubiad1 [Symbiodinium sp. CCMP2592]|nr:ubiad1 [Symbiodinium sp. CCMP2592]